MFDHSIRVPRLYKTASKIAKEVSEGKGSIKQLVYEGKHPNIKALYALVVQTFQKTDDIENLLKKSKLLVKEPRIDLWLAKILITELLWGKKRLAGQSKPVKTILAYEQIFKAHLSDVCNDDIPELTQVYKPRYVRINTLKTTINETIETFRDEGWFLKRYTDTSDYLGFLDVVSNLGPEEFMVDLHIPYLLIFPQKTQFYRHRLYKNGSIILQDKASCLPVHILNPEPGSVVLDMCAAPGMKTTQCATIMQNFGKIYAVEIGKKRYETLNTIVESAGATCVETINADVLTISGEQYKDVDYILVDPSCSGSGITDRVEIGQQEIDQTKNRLDKLAGFQIKTLRHALFNFPKAKRVVYSTCSVYPEENEDVVRQVLETCFYFKLVSANQFLDNKWQNFGSSDFGQLGNCCLYSRPDIDLTSGFFVAVFERLEEGDRNPFLNQNLFLRKIQSQMRRERREQRADAVEGNDCEGSGEISHVLERSKIKKEGKVKIEGGSTENFVPEVAEGRGFEKIDNIDEHLIHKKTKKKNRDGDSLPDHLVETKHDEEMVPTVEENNDFSEDVINKKKRKKKKKTDDNLDVKFGSDDEVYTVSEDIVEKKKKKKRKEDDCVEEQVDSLRTGDIRNDEPSQKKKKKKKKEKQHEDVDGSIETEMAIVEVNDEVATERKIKKKKKKEKNVQEDTLETREVEKSKKRKKRESSETVDLPSDDVEQMGENQQKKKKKTKN